MANKEEFLTNSRLIGWTIIVFALCLILFGCEKRIALPKQEVDVHIDHQVTVHIDKDKTVKHRRDLLHPDLTQ